MKKRNLKQMVSLVLSLILITGLAACGQPSADGEDSPSHESEPVELVVFAAASMTETLTEIGEMYKQVEPHVTLTFNFDSSGTLKTQIEEGAACDIFISAAQKQMNELDGSKGSDVNPKGLDFVEQGTRIDLLQNTVALAVPEGTPKNVMDFNDMAEKLKKGQILLAMGNEDVPVGQYTQKVLAFYGLDEEALAKAGCITYGSNVKEVTTQVDQASVDCGVIYGTDAYSAGLFTVDVATKVMCGQIIYPAAVLNISKHKEEATAYLEYLQSDECMAVFTKVGFAPVE